MLLLLLLLLMLLLLLSLLRAPASLVHFSFDHLNKIETLGRELIMILV